MCHQINDMSIIKYILALSLLTFQLELAVGLLETYTSEEQRTEAKEESNETNEDTVEELVLLVEAEEVQSKRSHSKYSSTEPSETTLYATAYESPFATAAYHNLYILYASLKLDYCQA